MSNVLGLGTRIKRALIFLGVRLLDLAILAVYLIWVLVESVEYTGGGLDWVLNGLWMFIGIVLVWVITVAFVEAICVYFRQDTTTARLLRTFVTTLLIITIFPLALTGVLWLMGYTLSADIQRSLYIVAIGRTILRAFLGRLAERRFPR